MPSLITKSARKATKYCNANVSEMATRAHRSYRRHVKQEMNMAVDDWNTHEEAEPDVGVPRKYMVTGWEVA